MKLNYILSFLFATPLLLSSTSSNQHAINTSNYFDTVSRKDTAILIEQINDSSSRALLIKAVQKKKEGHSVKTLPKNVDSHGSDSLSFVKNNEPSINFDSTKKVINIELSLSNNKLASQKYNRIVKIVNDKGFENLDSEKKFFASILDSLADINRLSPGNSIKRSNDFYLSRAYLISNYKSSHDSIANLDSLNQYLEKLYLRVLKRDYYNTNANYNIALLYYNQAVRISKRELSDTELDSTKSVTELEVKALMKKSLPYFVKASKEKSKSKEILVALSGIYFALGKDKAIVDNVLESVKDDDSFKSTEDQRAIIVNYEDSILKDTSFTETEKQEIIINYYISVSQKLTKVIESGRFVLKNLPKYENLIEELNNKVLVIDTLNILASKNLFDLHFRRFTELMVAYKDSSRKGIEKAEIRNQLVATEFDKVIPSLQKYYKLSGAADTLYFKSENGFLSILNAEEKVELERKLGPKMVIVKADK